MIRTRYAELAYEQHARDLWRIIDTETGAAVGPQYKSRAELLADLNRYARVYGVSDMGPSLPHAVDDYRNAPSGIGPLAAEWKDKPHRLVYDLCAALEQTGIFA